MWGKDLLFYFVASTIIALMLRALGTSFVVVVFGSLLGPTVIILLVRMLRYNKWLP